MSAVQLLDVLAQAVGFLEAEQAADFHGQHFGVGGDDLLAKVEVNPVGDQFMIEISAEDQEPEVAKAISLAFMVRFLSLSSYSLLCP